MVMVRLNHVTTRFDPLHYQTRADMTLHAPQLRFREQRTTVRPANGPRNSPSGPAIFLSGDLPLGAEHEAVHHILGSINAQ